VGPVRSIRATRGIPALAAVLIAVTVLSGASTGTAAADPGAGLAAPAHPTVADLSQLSAALADASSKAAAAAADAQRISAQQMSLFVARDGAADELAAARKALGEDVRRLYIAGASNPLRQVFGVTPDLTGFGRVRSSVLGVDTTLIERAKAADRALNRLEKQAAADRRAVLARAAVMETAQERARSLLDQAETAYAKDQAVQAYLTALRRALDEQAQQVAKAVAPVWESGGPVQSLGDQEPIVRLLEDTPEGQLPAGYHSTGQVLSGIASWYGPGFVGHPTSTGTPYDPERLTAAMLAVPLGTVVHVTSSDGRSVNVLVNDHGPYVDGRVIDLSHRAAQILGIGLGPVTVEVLAKN
jgi:3D (Asp-Asp-Asp) domain-containing protein